MFSSRALADFAKGILKLIVVGTVVRLILWSDRRTVLGIPSMAVEAMLALARVAATKVIVGFLAVITLAALADVTYQRFLPHKTLSLPQHTLKDAPNQHTNRPRKQNR